MKAKTKYYISSGVYLEKEVTKEEYIRHERQAGFVSKFGPNEIATSAFQQGPLRGRVEVNGETITVILLDDEFKKGVPLGTFINI